MQDQYEELKTLIADPKLLLETDSLGFTALEIAQFLGKQRCVDILQPDLPHHSVQVVLPGYHRTFNLNRDQFVTTFGARYRSFLNFQTYDNLREAIRNAPWILRSRFGDENRQLAMRFKDELQSGFVTSCTIKWVDDFIGYGLFTNETLKAGTYIGEYTGNVRRLYRFHPNQNAYCVHYPTKWWSWRYFTIDALKEGNELRFINHSLDPNVEAFTAIDRGILHEIFLAKRDIKAGEQLTVNYGADYWQRRLQR